MNVLVIGGSGKQASSAVLPAVVSASHQSVNLTAIADPTDPRASHFSNGLAQSFDRHSTSWIQLTADDEEANLARLDQFVATSPIHLVAVCSPPVTHLAYVLWGLRRGASVVCDKPLFAWPKSQLTSTSAPSIMDHFNELRSAQRTYTTPGEPTPEVYVPLMRRVSQPYTTILDALREVYEETAQPLTNLVTTRSDGIFRFAEEHDRPGAHGYRDGVGALTQSAYHYLDFMAACLNSAPPPSSNRMSCCAVDVTTVRDVVSDQDGSPFADLLGRGHGPELASDFTGLDAELEFELIFKVGRITTPPSPISRLSITLIQRGCTRRVSPAYPQSATHDEGLTNDCSTMIQQGPMQSFQLLVAQDGPSGGRITLARRLNPLVAKRLGRDTLEIIDTPVGPNENAMRNRAIVDEVIEDVRTGQRSARLAGLSLLQHERTSQFYGLAVAAVKSGNEVNL